MNRSKNLLFNILFLIAVLFSYGINTFSNHGINSIKIESSQCNSFNNELSSEENSFEDDQISQSVGLFTALDQKNKILVVKKYLLINSPLYSIWQPPKLS